MPVTGDIAARFQSAITAQDHQRIALAVSGGGDSIAMMHLAVRALGPERLAVFTIDHGLRPEAAKEIALVRDQAGTLGLAHHVGQWSWDRTGNLQSAARAGRLDRLRDMAIKDRRTEIWLGHTVDDQVETFLMRLARGSGVDGLAAMRSWGAYNSMPIFRPLLGIKRAELRDWLRVEGIAWCDDPSNDDTRFDRVKARQMADQLGALGLTEKRVLQTIDHMQAAQVTLQEAATRFAQAHYRQNGGDLVVAKVALDLSQADAPRRALAAAIGWIGGGHLRPRFDNLRDAVKRASDGQQVTLAGCLFVPAPDGTLRLMREAAATSPMTGTAPLIWDKRWIIEGPEDAEITVKALGDAITQCPNWRDTGMPRQSLLASPSIWQGDQLIAAPVAGLNNGWTARIVADYPSGAFPIEDRP